MRVFTTPSRGSTYRSCDRCRPADAKTNGRCHEAIDAEHGSAASDAAA